MRYNRQDVIDVRTAGYTSYGDAMSNLVNFNKFKKRNKRVQAAKQAETNRARFGRTKTQRKLDEQTSQRENDLLDQHRIDDEASS